MRHPEWLKVKMTGTHETKKVLRSHGVSTVCEEARCPNQGKCFSGRTAAFMILGDRCTRNCSFCAVKHERPLPPEPGEPERIADACISLGLEFVVITSVSRDDLSDKGASRFAETVRALRRKNPDIRIEILTPDFGGDVQALKIALDAGPDVFNHNVETVPRLYPLVRQQADYIRSIGIIKSAKAFYPSIIAKSGIMVGLGETGSEIISVMKDLREAGCDFLTIGQYLRPTRQNIPVAEYIRPEVFDEYKNMASPLTRSSMDAGIMYNRTQQSTINN
jgi:lipoic acid synthetase